MIKSGVKKKITALVIVLALSVANLWAMQNFTNPVYKYSQLTKLQDLSNDLLKNYDKRINMDVVSKENTTITYRVKLETSSPKKYYFININKADNLRYGKDEMMEEPIFAGDLYENIHVINDLEIFNENHPPSPWHYEDDYAEIMIDDLIGEDPVIINAEPDSFFFWKSMLVLVRNKEGELKHIKTKNISKEKAQELVGEIKSKDLLTKDHIIKLRDSKDITIEDLK